MIFNLNVYKKIYDDIKNLSDEDIIKHYYKFGIKEYRICNLDYFNINPIIYKKIYDDVKNLSDEDAIIHYIKFGRFENRIYNLDNYSNPEIYKETYNDIKDLSDEDAIIQYIKFGKKENRYYLNIVNNFNSIDIISNTKYYISIYLDKKSDETLNSLVNQYIKPIIIVNSNNNSEYINNIISLCNSDIKFDDDDIIIFVKDSVYDKYMSLYYLLAYQLYNCSSVFINDSNILFYDNYQGNVYSELSFSFKYKYIKKIHNFYNLLMQLNIKKSDNIILTSFYKIENLYSVGIGRRFNNISIEESYNIFNIPNNIIYEINDTNKRDLLFNINNITYEPDDDKQLDFKYLDKDLFIITITFFKKSDKIEFYINSQKIIMKIDNNYSNRISYMLKIDNYNLEKIEHNIFDFKIMQILINSSLTYNKFLSILTITSNLPDIEYIFFNTENTLDYINKNFPKILYFYNKLIPNAYKTDLFRALYIYKEGGIYFDCKNILYFPINFIKDYNSFFCKDTIDNYIYNGFFYSKKNNPLIRKYIIKMILNINNNYYNKDCLSITGPGLLGSIIDENIIFINTIKDDWMNNIIKYNNKKYIKASYNDYYYENNYIHTYHYSNLWNNREVYNNSIDYKKINFIDGIIWINLDRSKNRKNNMIKLLSNIDIPNYRITAIDGKEIDYNLKITNYEIACSLSHIKAINFTKELKGNYFMICEDDISLNNLIYFEETLEDIILKSPKFDILMINMTSDKIFDKDYINWNEEYKNNNHIASTVSYIISRDGLNKNINIENLDVADKLIYSNYNTYCYRYSYITTQYNESIIHKDHLEWHKFIVEYNEINIIDKKII